MQTVNYWQGYYLTVGKLLAGVLPDRCWGKPENDKVIKFYGNGFFVECLNYLGDR